MSIYVQSTELCLHVRVALERFYFASDTSRLVTCWGDVSPGGPNPANHRRLTSHYLAQTLLGSTVYDHRWHSLRNIQQSFQFGQLPVCECKSLIFLIVYQSDRSDKTIPLMDSLRYILQKLTRCGPLALELQGECRYEMK